MEDKIKSKLIRSIYVVVIAILSICNANGQKKKNNNANVVSNYLKTSFDLNLNKIPIDFKGHNVTELYKKLAEKQVNFEKSEFETYAQYEERMRIESSKPILGNLNEESIFAIKNQEPNLYPSNFKYDADSQEIELAIELKYFINNGGHIEIDEKRKSIEIKSFILKDKNYQGTNAFGVSKEINSTKSSVYCLLIDNWKSFANEDSNVSSLVKFNFKVNPIVAKKIKETDLHLESGQLKFLYIGKVVKPYTTTGHRYREATISFPYESEKNINYINFDLNEIWVYNKNTGEVYTKIKPQKDLICDIKYTLVGCKLISEISESDLYKFNEEGVITCNVSVLGSDMVLVKGISSPTTINDMSLQMQAKYIISRLKFSTKNKDELKGTITLTFERR